MAQQAKADDRPTKKASLSEYILDSGVKIGGITEEELEEIYHTMVRESNAASS